MAYVPIPKDLNKVQTKIAFNLTKRQLIGFSLAGLIGLPVYLGMKQQLPTDAAVLVMLVVTLYEKDGLPFEKYFKYVYLHKFYQPAKRIGKEEIRLERQKKTSGKKVKAKRNPV